MKLYVYQNKNTTLTSLVYKQMHKLDFLNSRQIQTFFYIPGLVFFAHIDQPKSLLSILF